MQELRGITPSLGLKMYFFEIYNIFKRFPLQKLKIEKWTCSSIFCQDKRCGFECGKVILIVHNCGLCGLLGWHLFMKNAPPPWRLFAASWIYRDQWLDELYFAKYAHFDHFDYCDHHNSILCIFPWSPLHKPVNKCIGLSLSMPLVCLADS